MKLNFTIVFLLLINTCFSQEFTRPNTICDGGGNRIETLQTYKDAKGNEYIIWAEIPPQGYLDSTATIRLQKYDSQDMAVFPACGIVIKALSKVSISGAGGLENGGNVGGISCIADENENLYIFFSFGISRNMQDGGLPIDNLVGFKIDKNGNNLWGADGILLAENKTNLLFLDIAQTSDNDIHILLSVSGNARATYLRISIDGIKRFADIVDLGGRISKALIFPFDLRQNSSFYKNSQGELIAAVANYDFNLGFYSINTYKVDNQGNVSSKLVEANSGQFVQFNMIENKLYYTKQVNTTFPMYDFRDDGTANSSPTITFLDEPGIPIVRIANAYFYLAILPNENGFDKISLQKIDFNGAKLLGNNGYELIESDNSVGHTIKLFPDTNDGIKILYQRLHNNGSSRSLFLTYQYIPNTNIPQFPDGTKIYNICDSLYPYDTGGSAFLDNKDGSLNVYLSYESNQTNYALLRQDLYLLENLVACPPFIISKSKK